MYFARQYVIKKGHQLDVVAIVTSHVRQGIREVLAPRVVLLEI
jgi:hypothetical protein